MIHFFDSNARICYDIIDNDGNALIPLSNLPMVCNNNVFTLTNPITSIMIKTGIASKFRIFYGDTIFATLSIGDRHSTAEVKTSTINFETGSVFTLASFTLNVY